MATFKFTIDRIAELACAPGKAVVYHYDSDAPGLGIRVTTSGAKSYIFQSYIHNKQFRMTIGDVSAWRLDAPARSSDNSARKEARRLQTLCDAGIDPRQEKADRKAEVDLRKTEAAARKLEEQRQLVTLGDVWPIYIDARRSKWGERHLQDHYKIAQQGGEPVRRGKGVTKPGPLAILLPIKLSELTQSRVASWAEEEGQTRPARVALAHRLLIGFASWCREQEEFRDLLPEGVFSSKGVREAIPKAQAKDDCLQKEQLAVWFDAVRQESPVMSAYLQALLLTGARREELAGLRWVDVDFKWMSMAIKDKVEGERTIPLTPYLSALLDGLSRRNEWVFASPTAAGGRIVEPRIAHNHALEVAGIPTLTLHGLRRSFGTLAEWVEAPAGVVAQIMGHKPSAIAEKHYRRRPLDLLRMWHTKIECWILEQAGIEQSDSVKARINLVKSA